jgi:hypothetical protein
MLETSTVPQLRSPALRQWLARRRATLAALPKAEPAIQPVQVAGRASQALSELARNIEGDDMVSLGVLIDRLGSASLGLVLLMLTIPAVIPIPGPVGMVLGSCLALVAVQVMAGATRIWLPTILRRRSLPTRSVVKAVEAVNPWLVRFERRLTPRRWMSMSGRAARPFLGFCILAMAIIITLPIPLGNILPVIALAMLSLALLERDGVAVMWAAITSMIAIVWTVALVLFGAEALTAVWTLVS